MIRTLDYKTSDFHRPASWFNIRTFNLSNYQEGKEEELHVSQTILERIASGDNAAVKECLDKYAGLVWSLARKMLPDKNEAEDAVQEIFIEIWKNAERFDASQASETTFIAMIARRRLIDRLRKVTRQPDIDSFEDMVYEPARTEGVGVQMSVEARQAAEAINTLRPEQRQVLELSIVQGYSHQEISDALKMPLGTVKTHARRGIMQVRELLIESGTNSGREVSA
jgi:RNA polymerase sigma-70 factor (ECF subfamily)